MKTYDSIIIGGGQAGLSMAYFLRRNKIDYLVLDSNSISGGSWLDTWDSLRLFSPTEYNSLSGWPMPKSKQEYPTRNEFITYLKKYEERYKMNIKRNINVISVTKKKSVFVIQTNQEVFYAKTVVSATGTAKKPYIPKYTNHELYEGIELHSIDFKNTDHLIGKRVLIVGGGNSGAQILAEVSKVASTQWVTLKEPVFLPDNVDGRYLFNTASNNYRNKGKNQETVNLGNVVMIDVVKDARKRNVLSSKRPFLSFFNKGVVWADGTKEDFDVVIWCTGFKANLEHLKDLGIVENNKILTKGTNSVLEPKLWLLGYGNWTGFASATIYGVGKTARKTASEIQSILEQ